MIGRGNRTQPKTSHVHVHRRCTRTRGKTAAHVLSSLRSRALWRVLRQGSQGHPQSHNPPQRIVTPDAFARNRVRASRVAAPTRFWRRARLIESKERAERSRFRVVSPASRLEFRNLWLLVD